VLKRLTGIVLGALAGCAADITAAGVFAAVGLTGDGLTGVSAVAGVVSGIIIAVKVSSSQQ